MADGGRTIDERERAIIDLIAQRLGTAMSVQSSWRTFDKRAASLTAESAAEWEAGDEDGFATRSTSDTEYLGDESHYLSVVRRDRRNPMLAEDKDDKGCKDDETNDSVSGASDGQEAMLAKFGRMLEYLDTGDDAEYQLSLDIKRLMGKIEAGLRTATASPST